MMPEEDIEEQIRRFQDLAVKILIPMDIVINRLHRKETIRRLYFALADSRERLIQFLNIKRIDNFVTILLQMNQLLNKMTYLKQETQFSENESVYLIVKLADWRSLIYKAVVYLTKNGF